ncbi:hypothetical protein Syun_014080 [Stephania yunnanensis]|uniref:Uncharacterized protein n=1 Tax=Stephania yunnanensis TaxID=152371 RepID=A0AAP0JJF3_9MAGN
MSGVEEFDPVLESRQKLNRLGFMMRPQPPSPNPCDIYREYLERKLVLDEAVAYLYNVKQAFRDMKEKYDEFVRSLREFQPGRIGPFETASRVVEILEGHTRLSLSFLRFLPQREVHSAGQHGNISLLNFANSLQLKPLPTYSTDFTDSSES